MKHHITFFDANKDDAVAIRAYFRNHENIEINIVKEGFNAETVAEARGSDIISVFVSSKVTPELMEQIPNLKLIVTRSTGFDNVDLTAASKRDVVVCNVPGYGENTVAEYAFTLLLAVSRKLVPALENAKCGHIDHTGLTGFDLKGKTLGIIGTGRIGKHVIRIARGFEMRVFGFDPYPNDDLAYKLGFDYTSLDELLGVSDVITIHAPYTKDNHHLINERTLSLMKKTAVLINTARGEIVDTKALVAALLEGRLAGAGLDVVERENLMNLDDEMELLSSPRSQKDLAFIAEHMILEKLPNVVLAPHNAFNTIEALDRIRNTSFQDINAYLSGTPQNQVN